MYKQLIDETLDCQVIWQANSNQEFCTKYLNDECDECTLTYNVKRGTLRVEFDIGTLTFNPPEELFVAITHQQDYFKAVEKKHNEPWAKNIKKNFE